MQIEMLEPRLLLAADPISEAARQALEAGFEGFSEWADRFAEIEQLTDALPMVAAVSAAALAPRRRCSHRRLRATMEASRPSRSSPRSRSRP
jgi:hypothetical protein